MRQQQIHRMQVQHMYMLAVEVGSRYSPIKALAIAIRTIAIAIAIAAKKAIEYCNMQ